MPEHIGIDFGTTNSVLGRLIEEPARVRTGTVASSFGEARIPSAVAVDRQGRWLFGQAAKEADAPAKVLSVKRLLGSGQQVEMGGLRLRPEFIAALLFRHLVLEGEKALGEPVRSAVVTVPANSKGLQRNATKVAAAAAGLRVLNLINEPTAAAMAYGLDAGDRDKSILVYDFGGGTFDVTVLRAHHGIFEEVASRGLARCGGDDLDQALARHVAPEPLPDPIAELRLRLACEAAKIELSEVEAARIDLEQDGINLHASVTRETLESLARPLIDRTETPVREALAAAGLAAAELDHVLLVGGTSRMPLVRSFVEELLDRPAEPFAAADPMTCVAEGAAIVAGILNRAGGMESVDYQVCLEHSLCIEPVDPLTGRRFLDPIIEHGTKIPSRNTKIFYPVADQSAEVLVRIWEGNEYDLPASEENVRIGQVQVPLDPPRPAEDCPIEVQFEYSEDGLLTATATDLRVGRTVSQAIDYRRGALTGPEQEDLRVLLTEVFGEPPPEPTFEPRASATPVVAEAPELQEARRRLAMADKVLAALEDPAETAELRRLRDALGDALGTITPLETVAHLDRELSSELLFFDYLL